MSFTAPTITGYVTLSPEAIEYINNLKELERQLAVAFTGTQNFLAVQQSELTKRVSDENSALPTADSLVPRTDREEALKRHADNNYQQRRVQEANRQMALARTAFEQAFMHLTRAIAQPHSPWIDARNRTAPE